MWLFCFPNQRMLMWAQGRARWACGHRAVAGRAGRAGRVSMRQAGLEQAGHRQGRLGAGRGSGELRWVQVGASGGLRLAQVGSGGPRAGRAGLEQGTGPWQAGQGRAGRAVAAGFKAPGRLGAGRAQAGRQGWPSRGVDVKSSRTFGANSGATRKHSLHASHRVLNSSWRRPAKFSGLRHTPPFCPRKHSARKSQS